jgi:hypothetical protein
LPSPPPSGGLAANENTTGFGALAGRVGEWCSPGDPACDAPGRAAALRTAAGLATQADLRDPISAATSIANAWQHTATAASVAVALNDIHIDKDQVDYVPSETVSDRIADAADPRSVADPQQTAAAADKVNRAITTVAADPVQQLPRLAGQIGAAVQADLAANADLLNPATFLAYANAIGNHTSYATDGATQQAAAWFGALSRDIHTSRGER